MSRYYNIPNKVNLPMSANSHESESILLCKPKPAVIVEHEKRSPWSLRSRHANISLAKENTPPRRAHLHHSRLYKPWQTFVKASVSKIGKNSTNYFFSRFSFENIVEFSFL